MEKIIEIDLLEPDYLYEKYNHKKVSKELIDYIINMSLEFDKNDSFKIILNNYLEDSQDAVSLIKEGLNNAYNKSYQLYLRTGLIQAIYFIAGIITLSLSRIIPSSVIREVVLICGWVLIWTMVELEIFSDASEKHKRKILKKILNGEFVENHLARKIS